MKVLQSIVKPAALGTFLGLALGASLTAMHVYVLPSLSFKGDVPLTTGGKVSSARFSGRGGKAPVNLRMRNVYFRLTHTLAFQVHRLRARVYPISRRASAAPLVDFDDINSFFIYIHSGHITLSPRVLMDLFNGIVLKYPEAPLRKLKIQFIPHGALGKKEPVLKLNGEMKLVTWLGFEMLGRLSLDEKNNAIIIEAISIKTLGTPYARGLMDLFGLRLQSFVQIAGGRGVVVRKNKIIISPLRILPPPLIRGEIKQCNLDLKSNRLVLRFGAREKLDIPEPVPAVRNYLMLKKGRVAFGKLLMRDADVLMVDASPEDPFDFYLARYFRALTRGRARIAASGAVIAFMPDYGELKHGTAK